MSLSFSLGFQKQFQWSSLEQPGDHASGREGERSWWWRRKGFLLALLGAEVYGEVAEGSRGWNQQKLGFEHAQPSTQVWLLNRTAASGWVGRSDLWSRRILLYSLWSFALCRDRSFPPHFEHSENPFYDIQHYMVDLQLLTEPRKDSEHHMYIARHI